MGGSNTKAIKFSYKNQTMNLTASELFDLLNQQDECPWIEAKGGDAC